MCILIYIFWPLISHSKCRKKKFSDFTQKRIITKPSFYATGQFVAVEALTHEDESGEYAVPQQEITGTLVSPVLEYSEWSCLRLVYQIISSGSLEVLQRTEGKSFDKPLWSGQTPSDSWVISSMDLRNNTEPYKVLFIIIYLVASIIHNSSFQNKGYTIYNDLVFMTSVCLLSSWFFVNFISFINAIPKKPVEIWLYRCKTTDFI